MVGMALIWEIYYTLEYTLLV